MSTLGIVKLFIESNSKKGLWGWEFVEDMPKFPSLGVITILNGKLWVRTLAPNFLKESETYAIWHPIDFVGKHPDEVKDNLKMMWDMFQEYKNIRSKSKSSRYSTKNYTKPYVVVRVQY